MVDAGKDLERARELAPFQRKLHRQQQRAIRSQREKRPARRKS
jgi:hypothetical protein